ncbi:type II secretion system F family protein [Hankyongella ginsenosidimutans]|uniref:Type II secretion system F family protein n=1 Tax=Hankyongella ginsenosidimutans TaxID=1763828 RepID=A0A4D7CA07_9SPHN|nr:type II secretion system F family protein [Hankyongella ginsenosidimutans]QCI79963.1 type II secretion system F family protein [Hankyongella ginsenosidimutans]
MATFRYRAVARSGEARTGTMEAQTAEEVIARLQRSGLSPIEAKPAKAEGGGQAGKVRRASAASRQTVIKALGELAVLLDSGLTLDRALAIIGESIQSAGDRAAFADIQQQVKEGAPLSAAMARHPGLFSPMAWAMAEAGEASGGLAPALAKLADTLDRGEALRQTVVSAMVYPSLLVVVAGGVILMMLIGVVPQFADLFGDDLSKLPATTQAVLAASTFVRTQGLTALLAIGLLGVALAQVLRQPETRLSLDRLLLRIPGIGALIRDAETARFARVLGSLIDGGVPLPSAVSIAQRSLTNSHMASAILNVARGLKEGGGLSGPLAATGLFPRMAMSFLKTGEETAQLGLMLGRLADVLDRQVKQMIARLISVLTPAITVVLAGFVALVIVSIMSAILSFNDLALAS